MRIASSREHRSGSQISCTTSTTPDPSAYLRLNFSSLPLQNPIGFGTFDFLELAVAVILVALVFASGVRMPRSAVAGALGIGCLPVILRLALLGRFPVPVPNIYDEFGHLLVADTLRHWRLANPPHPMHRFFETIFVIQQPSYSSIYPIGNGLALALFSQPWVGVLLTSGVFCALCYWMLRAWVPARWALTGGLLAVMEFGPLNQWMNSYWGGGVAAIAGCLVFGALPRMRDARRRRDQIALGLGLGLHVLTRPYESVFLFAAAGLYFAISRMRFIPWISIALVIVAFGITGLQNKRVTGEWTTLPYSLSQYQYGVPAGLTFQSDPVPHLPLTREQQLEYEVQRGFQQGPETASSYFSRLMYRARYYRFFFLPPLYIAVIAFLVKLRSREWLWVAATCLLFALGINFFPAFQYHYLAGVACLFVLMSVQGLRSMPVQAAQALLFLCIAQFTLQYALSRPQSVPERRVEVSRQLAATPGSLLVFVRYWPNHVFQDEWVYNGADIDAQRVVMARDLGDEEDLKLAAYYGNRTKLLLEPDARPPKLTPWEPAPKPPIEVAPTHEQHKPPLLELEQVR